MFTEMVYLIKAYTYKKWKTQKNFIGLTALLIYLSLKKHLNNSLKKNVITEYSTFQHIFFKILHEHNPITKGKIINNKKLSSQIFTITQDQTKKIGQTTKTGNLCKSSSR